jgi:hypothetical protein
MLVAFADSSVSNNPVQSFILQLSGADVPPRNSISRAPGTRVTIEVPPGRFAVTIREVGYETWRDSITIRLGYADTLRVGLGTRSMCFF